MFPREAQPFRRMVEQRPGGGAAWRRDDDATGTGIQQLRRSQAKGRRLAAATVGGKDDRDAFDGADDGVERASLVVADTAVGSRAR